MSPNPALWDTVRRCGGRCKPTPSGNFTHMTVNSTTDLPHHHMSHWPEQIWRGLNGLYLHILDRINYKPLPTDHARLTATRPGPSPFRG